MAQQTLVIDVNVVGLNSNQRTAARQIGSACDASSEDTSPAAQDLRNTCALIAGLDENDPEDSRQLRELLDTVAPEEAFSVGDAIVYTSNYQVTNIHSRINVLRASFFDEPENDSSASNDRTAPTTMSASTYARALSGYRPGGGGASADEGSTRLGMFFSGQLSDGDVDGDTFEQDAELGSNSFTVGVDYRLSNNLLTGVGFGSIQDTTEFSDVDGGTDSQGFNFTAFTSWYREDHLYLDLVFDAGQRTHDLERGIGTVPGTPVRALGSTDSTTLSLTASGGRNVDIGAWELGSYFRLSLTSATVDSYTETPSSEEPGFGSVFSIGSQSVNSTNFVLGGEVSRAIGTGVAVLIPVFRLEYELESEDKKENLATELGTSEIAGSFRGTNRDTGYANLGLGGSAVFRAGKSAYAFYEARLLHDFVTQNWLKIGLRLEF